MQSEGKKFSPDQLRLVFMVESFSWKSFRSEWEDGGAKIWVDELEAFLSRYYVVCVCARS